MRRILGTRRFSAPLASVMLILMTHAIWGLVSSPASGQSVAPGAASAPAPGATKPASSIPPPTRFQPSDPVVRRARLAITTVPPGRQDGMAAQSVPTAVALPVANGAGSTARPEGSPITPPPPPRMPVDTALIPGRAVEPIDLANALILAGARDLDIAIARQRILQAAADLKQARVVAAIAVLRADMVSGGRSDPDRHRPGRDDRPQLAVPRRHRGAGQLLPRPIAGDWLPFVERSQHDPPDLRCDLRAHGGATQSGRESGWAPDRDQRRVATYRRSLLRSPGRQRSAGYRP